MRKVLITLAAAAGIAILALACGGGDDDDSNATAEPSSSTNASATGSTASAEELAHDLATLKSVMLEVKETAEEGDVEGAREAEGKGDDAIEALIKALKDANPSLADQLEALELDYEEQADAATTDLTVMAKDAQDVLDLLDDVAAALDIQPLTEDLSADLAELQSVMLEVKEKAEEGDVQGTRDAEGKGDDAIEALIKALRSADPALADQLEALELDYEEQADSNTTDLTVMAKDAQDVLDLLDDVAAALNIEAPPDTGDLSADLATIKTVMEETKAKAEAGDVQGTRDAEGQGDDAIEALIKALRSADPALADQLENLELGYEEQADSANPDLTIIAQDAQGVLDLLDDVATALNIQS